MNTYTSSGIPSAAAEAGIGDEEGLTMMRNEGNEVEGGVERKRGEKFLTLRERERQEECLRRGSSSHAPVSRPLLYSSRVIGRQHIGKRHHIQAAKNERRK